MSDSIQIPAARLEEFAAIPVRLAELEAAELVKRGDTAGAVRRLQEGLAQQAAARAAVQPVPAPLAAPGSPVSHKIPVVQAQGESLGAFWTRRGAALHQAGQAAGDGTRDLSLPMGLKARR
jgi:hypothetical protein